MSDLSMIGEYGEWAAGLVSDPAELSFRRDRFRWDALEEWRGKAVDRTLELVAKPEEKREIRARVSDSYESDDLYFEELTWQLPYGPPTQALFIKPAGSTGPMPALLGLHDHSAMKYFGWQKIAANRSPIHPLLAEHRAAHYGGRSWANELARRGYALLIHDVFPFGSRRIEEADVDPVIRSRPVAPKPESIEQIINYNRWSADHESVVAKSLFCAGTTWPGVYLYEDQVALDYLCSREEVDPGRVGCCGLSGGGMRAAYLSGLDPRIAAGVCVGFMTTWRDFLLHKAYTHTWMAYTPLLPRALDFPEIAALRVPHPFFVQNNSDDELFTLPEMERAADILRAVYRKCRAEESLRIGFYPGPHKFDLPMQTEAFDWLDSILKA